MMHEHAVHDKRQLLAQMLPIAREGSRERHGKDMA